MSLRKHILNHPAKKYNARKIAWKLRCRSLRPNSDACDVKRRRLITDFSGNEEIQPMRLAHAAKLHCAPQIDPSGMLCIRALELSNDEEMCGEGARVKLFYGWGVALCA